MNMPKDAKPEELDELGQPRYPYMDESGTVDISQIECNLMLTPAERIRRHQDFLEIIDAFRKAGDKYHGRESSAS